MIGLVALVHRAAEVFYFNCMHCGTVLPPELRDGGVCQECERTLMRFEEPLPGRSVRPAKVERVRREKPRKAEKKDRVTEPDIVYVPDPDMDSVTLQPWKDAPKEPQPAPETPVAEQKPARVVRVSVERIVGPVRKRAYGCKCAHPNFVKDSFGTFCNVCGKPKI